MKVTFLYADSRDEWNCSEWRCVIPADAINRTNEHEARYLWVWEGLQPSGLPHIDWADLVVIERFGWNLDGILRVGDFIKALKSVGKKVMLDFDDAYHLMPASVKNSVFWRRNLIQIPEGVDVSKRTATITYASGRKVPAFKAERSILQQFRQSLRTVDGFSTPSELLTADFANLNPNHHVIRNHPDLDRPEWHTKKRAHGDQIVIGWGGGSTHYESFRQSGIAMSLGQIVRRYPSVRIWLCTNDGRLPHVLRLPPEKVVLVKYQKFHEWPLILDNFDIGIAPLAGKYDDRRSYIKALEYSLKRIPWVATEAPPYESCPGGLLARKPNQWYRHLVNLIEGHELRNTLGREGYEWAKGQGVDDHIQERLDIYERIIAGGG